MGKQVCARVHFLALFFFFFFVEFSLSFAVCLLNFFFRLKKKIFWASSSSSCVPIFSTFITQLVQDAATNAAQALVLDFVGLFVLCRHSNKCALERLH